MDDEMLNLKCGGRWDIWATQLPAIARFVDLHAKDLVKVQVAGQAPVAIAQSAAVGAGVETSKSRAAEILIWDPRFGGMKMPHLHYKGEIFALNSAQWAEFSKTAVTSLADKLGKAQNVTFENLMDVSRAIAGI